MGGWLSTRCVDDTLDLCSKVCRTQARNVKLEEPVLADEYDVVVCRGIKLGRGVGRLDREARGIEPSNGVSSVDDHI